MGDKMTTEAEQQVEQEQEAAAFAQGFDSIRGSEGAQQPPEQESEQPEAKEPEQDPEQAGELPLFAGLTESEIKSLLQRAAKVDAIEDQLGKAHGKIGELNRTLQEWKASAQRPTQQSAPASEHEAGNPESEFEQTFPEFGPAVEARARRIAQEVMQQQAASSQPADPEAINKAVNLAVMDATHKGWRETVASQDFDLWIAAQPEEDRQTYATTWDHNELGTILGRFAESRRAVADRTTKSKNRLESALTPDSRSGRVNHAPTEIDAMQAGFDAVRSPRYYTTR